MYPAGKTAHTGLKPGTTRIWQVYLNPQRMQSTTNTMKIMSNCQTKWWVRLWNIHGENWTMFPCGGQVKLKPDALSRQTWSWSTKKTLRTRLLSEALELFCYGTHWDIMEQHEHWAVMPVFVVAHLSRNNCSSWDIHWEVGRLTCTSFPAGLSATSAQFSSPGPPQCSSGSSWTSCNGMHWPAVSCQCF